MIYESSNFKKCLQYCKEEVMSTVKVSANLPKWIGEHLHRYLESNGADGHMWDSTPVGGPGLLPTLLLTTTGRRSGQPIIMPLIYGEAGGKYVIVASKGGAPAHPGWYLNLVAHPTVEVQVGADRFRATARTTTGEERGTPAANHGGHLSAVQCVPGNDST